MVEANSLPSHFISFEQSSNCLRKSSCRHKIFQVKYEPLHGAIRAFFRKIIKTRLSNENTLQHFVLIGWLHDLKSYDFGGYLISNLICLIRSSSIF